MSSPVQIPSSQQTHPMISTVAFGITSQTPGTECWLVATVMLVESFHSLLAGNRPFKNPSIRYYLGSEHGTNQMAFAN